MSKETIRGVCDVLFYSGQVTEIRALGDNGTHIGYYSNWDRLAQDIDVLDGSAGFKGIYCVLNPVNPALLARKANRISRQGKNDAATQDTDVIRRRWLPIDIDPKRPSGISSSDAEHEHAHDKAKKIRAFLTELGWPEPVYADSGNGAHLLYRIDTPNDPESTELVVKCLKTLDRMFSDKDSDVDTSVTNPSRLWKLYGTVSRKGDNTEDRPHRESTILELPDDLTIVPVHELMHLGSILGPDDDDTSKASRNIPTSATSVTDLGDWLMAHGIGFDEKPYSGGRLFVLDECPFSSAHKDGAYAIQFASGAIFAGCHHNSCGGGEQRWSELRERYEGPRPKRDYDKWRKDSTRKQAEAKAEYYGNVSENAISSDQFVDVNKMVDHAKEAFRVLKEGDPVEYILDSFKTDHEGDETVARCLIMSFASRTVINSNGLHVLVTGESGKGKSHAFDTMLNHIPPEFRLGGRLSDKALFYAEDMRAGSAICLDDVGLSDQMQETLKGVTTSFKKPFVYRTVNKDRKGQTCIIPERCVWWVAKVEGSGDDQVWNRMLTCWIDDSEEQDELVLARELEAAESLPADEDDLRFETVVCHHIWNQLTPVHVVIPFAKRIRFSSSANRRNPGMLLDLIKSVATLHQHQRERSRTKGRDVIYATVDDFRKACRIYQALNGECGSQASKLTRKEAELATKMQETGRAEFTMQELIDIAGPGASYGTLYKRIHGGNSHQTHYDGLLEKCPAITFVDRTDVSDSGGNSKRQRVYIWNRDQYEMWISGGGCWLDSSSSSSSHDGGPGADGHSGNVGTIRNDSETLPTINGGRNEEKKENNKKIDNNNKHYRKDEEVQSIHKPTLTYNSAPENFRISDNTSEVIPSEQAPPAVVETEDDLDHRNISQPSAITPKLPLSDIDPDDFGPINGVWGGPCAVCGGKWVQYTEKFSQKQKDEGRFSRKICAKCYSKAIAKKSLTFTALPGMLNTANMRQTNVDIGRCDVCKTGAATWVDQDTKQKICQVCYSREQSRPDVSV